MINISVVVPVFAGEEYLEKLADKLEKVRVYWEEGNFPIRLSEAIFVDDCSIDNSPLIIDGLEKKYGWFVALHLSRNSGQHPATIAGILHSSGDWVVSLDEDLQHPPESIEGLLRHAARYEFDVVYAEPNTMVHESRARDATSRTYKRLVEWLTGNPHIRKANSFRLIRGSIARAAASACSHDTYLDVALAWFTQRFGSLPMTLKDQRYIKKGESGYNFRSLISHARRLLVSSHLKVLRGGAFAGVIAVVMSVFGGIGLLLLKLIAPESIQVQGWTSLVLLILFFGGLLLFLVGVALEYLSFLVQKAHGRPVFFTIDRSADAELRGFFDATPQ